MVKKIRVAVAVKKIIGFPKHEIRNGEIIHKKTGMIFGKKVNNGWQQPDDEGGIISASTPAGLLQSLQAATKDYDDKHGF